MSQFEASGKVSLSEFARQIRGQLVPLGSHFSYFFTAVSLNEDDIKEYLEEPFSALPPSLRGVLPETAIVLVPFLERAGAPGANGGDELVSFDPPDEKRQIWDACLNGPGGAILVFGIRQQDVADYHYRFFRRVAALAADSCGADIRDQFNGMLADELSAGVHGEVDEGSWELKRALQQRQRRYRKKTKGFELYARQALVDTLTLYLHGICCDLDVETGPRQLASRHLRRRLELLQSIFPPPEGYAVFPEDLKLIETNGRK